jgi:acyl-CoA synthetase (AMP-forming)/AMP-acid ligase II
LCDARAPGLRARRIGVFIVPQAASVKEISEEIDARVDLHAILQSFICSTQRSMMPTAHRPHENILDRLRAHAETSPDQLAYRFLRDDAGSDTLTFGQLDRRVRGLAARLGEYAALGDRALLLYPPGLEFIEAFLACLTAGIIAVPAYPPRRNRKAERLWAIAEDARPRLILTTSQVQPTVETGELGNLKGLLCLATDRIEVVNEDGRPLPRITGATVALLQYTSGSTGAPRGVVVCHDNITSNERAIQAAFRHTQDSMGVNWLPVFHDMGLIGNILQPLFVGFPSVLLAANSFLREPVRWLRAITDYHATTAGAPNFAYDHCVRGVTQEQKQGLHLRSWTVAYNGAEPVRAATLDRFAEAFGSCGFRRTAFFPCYGLAEATLFVSGGPAGEEPRRRCVEASALETGQVATADSRRGRWLVGSGRPADETRVVAVDPASRTAVPDGRVGQLWVSSPGVTAGYWGRHADTRAAFGNYLANGEGPFLNTGDLGFLDGDEVYVTGRSKDVIIIRGRNIYPHDIESILEQFSTYVTPNGCAAFSWDADNGEQLCVVIRATRAWLKVIKTNEISQDLHTTLARICAAITHQFDIGVSEIHIVPSEAFPQTSSGKVQRHACRHGLRAGTLPTLFRWKANSAAGTGGSR